jgi:hypothetical protein
MADFPGLPAGQTTPGGAPVLLQQQAAVGGFQAAGLPGLAATGFVPVTACFYIPVVMMPSGVLAAPADVGDPAQDGGGAASAPEKAEGPAGGLNLAGASAPPGEMPVPTTAGTQTSGLNAAGVSAAPDEPIADGSGTVPAEQSRGLNAAAVSAAPDGPIPGGPSAVSAGQSRGLNVAALSGPPHDQGPTRGGQPLAASAANSSAACEVPPSEDVSRAAEAPHGQRPGRRRR